MEYLSTFLFSMYLNDLEQFLNDRNVNGLASSTEDFESELDVYHLYYLKVIYTINHPSIPYQRLFQSPQM
jgi:hypothetical protein